jgi:hypothetical protein
MVLVFRLVRVFFLGGSKWADAYWNRLYEGISSSVICSTGSSLNLLSPGTSQTEKSVVLWWAVGGGRYVLELHAQYSVLSGAATQRGLLEALRCTRNRVSEISA